MPTFLELAGVEVPDRVQSNSLVPLLRGEDASLNDIVVTSWPLYNPGDVIRVVDDWERQVREPLPSTIHDGEWTLVYSDSEGPVELYHTAGDPQQKRNVFRENLDVANNLHSAFISFLETHGTAPRLIESRRKLPLD
jgi:hypothetical protein